VPLQHQAQQTLCGALVHGSEGLVEQDHGFVLQQQAAKECALEFADGQAFDKSIKQALKAIAGILPLRPGTIRLSSQCLDRRIPDKQTLIDEIAAWEHDRNAHHTKSDWHFTTKNARIKLKHLYPSI
jgi:hypothetical protein